MRSKLLFIPFYPAETKVSGHAGRTQEIWSQKVFFCVTNKLILKRVKQSKAEQFGHDLIRAAQTEKRNPNQYPADDASSRNLLGFNLKKTKQKEETLTFFFFFFYKEEKRVQIIERTPRTFDDNSCVTRKVKHQATIIIVVVCDSAPPPPPHLSTASPVPLSSASKKILATRQKIAAGSGSASCCVVTLSEKKEKRREKKKLPPLVSDQRDATLGASDWRGRRGNAGHRQSINEPYFETRYFLC